MIYIGIWGKNQTEYCKLLTLHDQHIIWMAQFAFFKCGLYLYTTIHLLIYIRLPVNSLQKCFTVEYIMGWPAQCPVMNPIEKMWWLLRLNTMNMVKDMTVKLITTVIFGFSRINSNIRLYNISNNFNKWCWNCQIIQLKSSFILSYKFII